MCISLTSSFAVSAWAVENLIFHFKVNEFRLLEGEEQQQMAWQLVATFVAEDVPFQVNLEMQMRRDITAKVEAGDITVSVFDGAEKHCLNLLRYSVFPLWKASGSFKDLLKKHKITEFCRGKTHSGVS